MKIAIVGSIIFYKKFLQAKRELEQKGHKVVFLPVPHQNEFNGNKSLSPADKLETMQKFNRDLAKAGALLVMNFDKHGKKNYIGVNTIMEIGMAFNRQKAIFVYQDFPTNCADELEAIGAVAIGCNLSKIKL